MSEDVQLSESVSPPVAVGYTLFSHRAVGVASLLGGPLAGSILMGLNYGRLGRTAAVVQVIIFGTLITGLLIWAGWPLPDSFKPYIAFGIALAMRSSANSVQGAAVQQHVKVGGQLASMWSAAGVGLATLVSFLLIVLAYTLRTSPTKEVTIGAKDKVYYLEGALEQDAKRLGGQLKSVGYFHDRA
jgi:hypothetical protein